jgi:hypothetical protein
MIEFYGVFRLSLRKVDEDRRRDATKRAPHVVS